jgi:hypothetical protein
MADERIRRFPEGFRWGTATSAYQVEGGNTGSDWWAWELEPGRIAGGHRSGQACDWWRHAERDFDLMVGLHQSAARISVASNPPRDAGTRGRSIATARCCAACAREAWNRW